MAFGVTKRLVFYCIIATLGSVIYGWEVGMLKYVELRKKYIYLFYLYIILLFYIYISLLHFFFF